MRDMYRQVVQDIAAWRMATRSAGSADERREPGSIDGSDERPGRVVPAPRDGRQPDACRRRGDLRRTAAARRLLRGPRRGQARSRAPLPPGGANRSARARQPGVGRRPVLQPRLSRPAYGAALARLRRRAAGAGRTGDVAEPRPEKPLWEMWMVEGLGEGRWALLSKVHHCMVTGSPATDLMTVLLDATPEPAQPDNSRPGRPVRTQPKHSCWPRRSPAACGCPLRIARTALRDRRDPRRFAGSRRRDRRGLAASASLARHRRSLAQRPARAAPPLGSARGRSRTYGRSQRARRDRQRRRAGGDLSGLQGSAGRPRRARRPAAAQPCTGFGRRPGRARHL